jgi:type I restriction enzyme M protein
LPTKSARTAAPFTRRTSPKSPPACCGSTSSTPSTRRVKPPSSCPSSCPSSSPSASSPPSNIFATTGTNVSILFLDAANKEAIVLIDASKLGTKVKDGKNQKTLLATAEEDQIIRVFNKKEIVEDFSVVVSYEDITAKNYSLSAGQYFDVKVEHVEITATEFEKELAERKERLKSLFAKSKNTEKEIEKQLGRLVL